jgi:hypothetical protein
LLIQSESLEQYEASVVVTNEELLEEDEHVLSE